jgi:adenylate cyclase
VIRFRLGQPAMAEARTSRVVGDRQHTFLFADLAGFAALTEAHGDERAAELAACFFDCVRELLPAHGAEEVKTIGDASMLRCDDPADAIELGLRIVGDIGSRPEFPSVRVGIHTGAAVKRDDDWFGRAVNLAARLSGLAAGGEVLISEATRAAAGELAGLEFRSLGPQAFKNITESVDVFRPVRGDGHHERLPIDPVCRMAVDPGREVGTLVHDGTEYHFCSLRCAESFARSPEIYTTQPP